MSDTYNPYVLVQELKKRLYARADLLTGYGWTTVNIMDSLQLLQQEHSKSQSQQNHPKKNDNHNEQHYGRYTTGT